MLLTVPAVASCVVIVLGLMVGATAIAISAGPGWRELRWFGYATICAAVYAVCALESTLDVPPEWRGVFGRVGASSASLVIASWFVYFARRRGRSPLPWEKGLISAIVVIALAWQIPGLCRTSEVFVRTVQWLGVSYTTTRPTALGKITFVLLTLAVCILDARTFFAWRRGERGALADFVGVTVQLVAGVNDSLAASGKLETPYLLDIGQFAVVVAVGSTLVARFVADARALERSSVELRAAQNELVRRERLAALGELSAVVAHEVRNPVTVIFNAVSTMRKQRPSSEASTLLDIVEEEAERLKRVAGELLDFARPRNVAVESVSPARLIESAVEAALAEIDRGNDLVRIDTQDDLEVAGDEQLLRQALINLITNAVQATGRTEQVHVRVHADDSAANLVSFEVSDDGDGIARDVESKIFTPFFTTRASGTGLGLAIVKRIAEEHGGDVTWRPRSPRGVTFTLRIPRDRTRR